MNHKHHELWETMGINPKDQYPNDALMQVMSTIQNLCNCGGIGSNVEYVGCIASQFLCLASRAETIQELETNCRMLANMIDGIRR